MGTTPYIGFGNDTLSQQPEARKGDEILCPQCSGRHALECGTSNGEESDLLMFYRCGKEIYLGAVAGRLVVAAEPDVSGSI